MGKTCACKRNRGRSLEIICDIGEKQRWGKSLLFLAVWICYTDNRKDQEGNDNGEKISAKLQQLCILHL